ncbi:Glycine-rich RNA-binding protein 4, mitochondrial [Capsicum annuum]|uniref:glycine-rich RNA-binding protein 4, mitochondrial n=1 Tax=Capsicum annuum TaxID=4072 RepID=UPI0007BF4B55|nr:glycine-rich RNA-binding protein 4, mitochondrial [Capsicum annuum]XP_047268684.1 glycine-rich RNA-binding protein 4, mitochondrial [Capsicum annuum]KAF3616730.1 Glycine-rich RNA-binding protein 4, mitochondrial [Capsicum annuum]
MAYYNKLGGLLRQGISTGNAVSANSPTPAMLDAIRCMSSKLFVGGLSWGTNDQSLKDAFASFGEVVDAKVITDRDTGRSRGFGFVNFSDEECAKEAMNAMDGQQLEGRNIRVSIAQERAPRSGGFGGPGRFGGGYGGQANEGY